jgi:hypothetical protein
MTPAEMGGVVRIKIELDEETERKLTQLAVIEKRPIAWQAEYLLREILSGVNFPIESGAPAARPSPILRPGWAEWDVELRRLACEIQALAEKIRQAAADSEADSPPQPTTEAGNDERE